MKSTECCHRRAADALENAARAVDEAARAFWVARAQEWGQLADRADQQDRDVVES
jgi:hypothetical protein